MSNLMTFQDHQRPSEITWFT